MMAMFGVSGRFGNRRRESPSCFKDEMLCRHLLHGSSASGEHLKLRV
eukprot:gene10655-10726_t